jgi:riboflavin kinase / FMN adenylyltransferase
MEVIFGGIEELRRSFARPVVTLGNFDGVHLGHQALFRRLREEASRTHGEGIVITFEPHPLKVLSPAHCPPLLTPFRKKMMLMEASGVKSVLCIDFSPAFSKISPSTFFEAFLVEKLNTEKVIVGYDYRFGEKRKGDVKFLKEMGSRFKVDVKVMEALRVGQTIVSSSKIRQLILDGKVEDASRLLGRDYLVAGRVVEGQRRGQALGFPTANLEITDELYPKTGVYGVGVIWNRQSFRGLANVGYNPTFFPGASTGDKGGFSVEVYILNFSRNLYGEQIQVNFKKRIRDEIRFDTPAKLIDQIKKDVLWAQTNLFGHGVPPS